MGQKPYELEKYFALALDPIHIGTGGYRIGRVDNTIVREPATGIPKIPGTTIEGNCRNYAYLELQSRNENGSKNRKMNEACAKGKKIGDKPPCGECDICLTFGYTNDNKAQQALTSFTDARILFFPVATMIGPVWITCPMVLRDSGIKEINNNPEKEIPEPKENKKFIVPTGCKIQLPEERLNFGWLLLEKDNENNTNISNWVYEKEKKKLSEIDGLNEILNRIILVSNDLFSHIVNSNLEVRTSVSIDPLTGTAEEGALFTYEAIPRGTVFYFDVIYLDPEKFGENGKNINDIKNVVDGGLSYFEFLGIGGMTSRGFGRLKVLNLKYNYQNTKSEEGNE